MIDIHNHILPNIDDGAKSIEESINIIKNASDAGVTDIIVTPHFILNSAYDTPISKQEELFHQLNEKIKNIPVHLYLGNEVFIEHDLISLFNQNRFQTLNHSRYLLFELSLNNFYQGIYDLLFQLKSIGIEPILAHPERYSYLQKDPEIAFKLLSHGALFQVDAGSYYGSYGKSAKKLVKLLLKHHAVHFIASDTHHKSDLYYNQMQQLKTDLKKYYETEEIEELLNTNPYCVIQNQEILKKEIIPLKKTIFKTWK